MWNTTLVLFKKKDLNYWIVLNLSLVAVSIKNECFNNEDGNKINKKLQNSNAVLNTRPMLGAKVVGFLLLCWVAPPFPYCISLSIPTPTEIFFCSQNLMNLQRRASASPLPTCSSLPLIQNKGPKDRTVLLISHDRNQAQPKLLYMSNTVAPKLSQCSNWVFSAGRVGRVEDKLFVT